VSWTNNARPACALRRGQCFFRLGRPCRWGVSSGADGRCAFGHPALQTPSLAKARIRYLQVIFDEYQPAIPAISRRTRSSGRRPPPISHQSRARRVKPGTWCAGGTSTARAWRPRPLANYPRAMCHIRIGIRSFDSGGPQSSKNGISCGFLRFRCFQRRPRKGATRRCVFVYAPAGCHPFTWLCTFCLGPPPALLQPLARQRCTPPKPPPPPPRHLSPRKRHRQDAMDPR